MSVGLDTAGSGLRPRTDVRLVFRPAAHADGLPCWLAVPAHALPGASPLVAVHGIRRGAREQAELFGVRAAALGRVVVAPLFDGESWPTYQRLEGTRRSDLALLALIQQLRDEGRISGQRFDLFGFSAGAQFAHRFAMLHPGTVHHLNVAAAGWYTFPDQAAFPYGLRTGVERSVLGCRDVLAAQMRAQLGHFLRLPIRVLVGARDRVRDANLRTGPAIDRQQGRHRCARAERWVDCLTVEAAVRGVEPRVRLAALPAVGHDFGACVRRGGLLDHVLPVQGDAWAGPRAWPDAQLAPPPSWWPRGAALECRA